MTESIQVEAFLFHLDATNILALEVVHRLAAWWEAQYSNVQLYHPLPYIAQSNLHSTASKRGVSHSDWLAQIAQSHWKVAPAILTIFIIMITFQHSAHLTLVVGLLGLVEQGSQSQVLAANFAKQTILEPIRCAHLSDSQLHVERLAGLKTHLSTCTVVMICGCHWWWGCCWCRRSSRMTWSHLLPHHATKHLPHRPYPHPSFDCLNPLEQLRCPSYPFGTHLSITIKAESKTSMSSTSDSLFIFWIHIDIENGKSSWLNPHNLQQSPPNLWTKAARISSVCISNSSSLTPPAFARILNLSNNRLLISPLISSLRTNPLFPTTSRINFTVSAMRKRIRPKKRVTL